jgi:hypothetical protein
MGAKSFVSKQTIVNSFDMSDIRAQEFAAPSTVDRSFPVSPPKSLRNSVLVPDPINDSVSIMDEVCPHPKILLLDWRK